MRDAVFAVGYHKDILLSNPHREHGLRKHTEKAKRQNSVGSVRSAVKISGSYATLRYKQRIDTNKEMTSITTLFRVNFVHWGYAAHPCHL